MIMMKIEDFDISNVSANCEDRHTDECKSAIRKYLESDYGNSGLFAKVKIDEKYIYINQDKESEEKLDEAMKFLQQGDYLMGKPILEDLYVKYPNNEAVLYNLGMIYSDEGNLNKAIVFLTQATKINNGHAHAWTALAVAQGRSNDFKSAIKSANTAAQIDSDDPYVLRTAGSLLAQAGNTSRATALLEKAVVAAPDDTIALYSLAECLHSSDKEKNVERADELYEKVIELASGTSLAEKAKERRREFGYSRFREGGDLRPDAIMYCLDALNKFKNMSMQEIGGVAMETATLGQSGLEVNNPNKLYQLRTIAGNYSGLNVVCILHTAIQKIAAGKESGFDVQTEYEEALKLFNDE